MEYKRFEVDISTELIDQELDFGNSFRNFVIVQVDRDVSFRVNSRSGDLLYTNEIQGFQNEGTFRKLFLTTKGAGAAGQKMVVVVYR